MLFHMPRMKPELAYLGAVFKTIPKNRTTIAVTAVSGTSSLAAYAGKWIFLKAITADIQIMRGTHTLTTSRGFPLKTTSDPIDFYVDPDDTEQTLSHISSGAATIEVMWDE